jgi:hypothetical protein
MNFSNANFIINFKLLKDNCVFCSTKTGLMSIKTSNKTLQVIFCHQTVSMVSSQQTMLRILKKHPVSLIVFVLFTLLYVRVLNIEFW